MNTSSGQWDSARHISNSNCWSEQVPSTWRRVLGHAFSLGNLPHAMQYLGSLVTRAAVLVQDLLLLYVYVLQRLGSWSVTNMLPSSNRQLMILSYVMFISTWEPVKEPYQGLYPGSLIPPWKSTGLIRITLLGLEGMEHVSVIFLLYKLFISDAN